jgi:WhiB family redox-sensing transcriptional regulator
MADTRSTRETLAWQEEALCLQADPELFHAPGVANERDAKSVCARCDVRPACLAYALDRHEPWGVWGGLTETERRNVGRVKTARHLGPCEDCGRPRYSMRYKTQTLPEGGVWNGRNHSKGSKLCEECRAARQTTGEDDTP